MWTAPSGYCQCTAGYEASSNLKSCTGKLDSLPLCHFHIKVVISVNYFYFYLVGLNSRKISFERKRWVEVLALSNSLKAVKKLPQMVCIQPPG